MRKKWGESTFKAVLLFFTFLLSTTRRAGQHTQVPNFMKAELSGYRFLKKNNKATVSRYIKKTIDEGLIKPYDESALKKLILVQTACW